MELLRWLASAETKWRSTNAVYIRNFTTDHNVVATFKPFTCMKLYIRLSQAEKMPHRLKHTARIPTDIGGIPTVSERCTTIDFLGATRGVRVWQRPGVVIAVLLSAIAWFMPPDIKSIV